MLATYNFKIYYRRDKKNPADLLLYKPDYIVDNKRKKENSLKMLILKRVRFKILITNLSWEEKFLNLELFIEIMIKTVIYSKKS